MNVVVTGASGVLGGGIVKRLIGIHNVRATDVIAGEGIEVADLCQIDQIQKVVDGADVVIHCAAIHPWKQYTPDQYLDNNVKACYHVFSACVKAGVKRVIYTSSIAAISMPPAHVPAKEDDPSLPRDLYGMTKHFGEKLAWMFHTNNGMNVACLRPPTFIPTGDLQLGLGLLGSWTHPDNVIDAHISALNTEFTGYHVVTIANLTPYTAEDAEGLRTDPASVVERYYPGAPEFFASHGIKIGPITCYYDISYAKEFMNWSPKLTFGKWFAEQGR
jgi:nucleoside-diphosphate-sugar epimerase